MCIEKKLGMDAINIIFNCILCSYIKDTASSADVR